MTTITENFEKVLEEKKMPLKKQEIKNGQILFKGAFRIRKNLRLPFGIVFDTKDSATVDYQIVYHKLAYVKEYSKRSEVMDLINEFNEMKAGYYRLCIGGDGEIYMRLLARTGEDIRPVYEMMVMGGSIAKALLPEIEKITGEDTTTTK
ncbi:hypothetical protein [Lacticigenium naphthae]|uniref:hypothetical protein n=1 Tax=Lacticigenium naphthae TaxID=515351 RepID=UPI0003F57F2F|nr:hypothetical protein [Lacticigenium naphthae]